MVGEGAGGVGRHHPWFGHHSWLLGLLDVLGGVGFIASRVGGLRVGACCGA